MVAETILAALLRVNLVAGVAIVLMLALRQFVLRRLGASIAYWLWVVVPIAAAASLLPAREQVVIVPPAELAIAAPEAGGTTAKPPAAPTGESAQAAPAPFMSLPALADVLVAFWLLSAGVLLGRSIVSTRRLAADPRVGPALVGVLRPKLVLPADFETRFSAEERALILAHEEVHRVSGHTLVNGLVEAARCASWFNPLVHLAANRVRTDQELACDAAVIAEHPAARRAYAEALLKAQSSPAFLPLGCTWTSPSARRLAERIAMLGRPSLSRRGAVAGACAVAVAGLALGYAAWAQQPERLVTRTAAPEAVWTPAADAPEGVLSHDLEGQRHDFFIGLAQQGDIDVVFFGTTDTEMWWWQDRGRSVWDRAFRSFNAANFGSQGTQPDSLLWRMQNGELEGYGAKLIVLQAPLSFIGGEAVPGGRVDETVANFAAIIAEIRARQPQAKILLFAPVPRGQTNRDVWRRRAEANAAALSELVDNEIVFYADIGERFFLPDGSHNQEMWRFPPVSGPMNVGIQTPAYEAWAEELQPWLDRFVR